MSCEDTPLIRRSFTTRHLAPDDQFDAWCQLLDGIGEFSRVDPAKRGFDAEVTACSLGPQTMVNWSGTDSVIYDRTSKHIRSSESEGWALSFAKQGRILHDVRGQEICQCTGDLMLKPLEIPVLTTAHGGRFLTVHLKRDAYSHLAGALDKLEYRTLNGPIANLLKGFLITLASDLQSIGPDRMKMLSQSFDLLLAAAIEPTEDNMQEAVNPINAGKLNTAITFIRKHLRSRELSADFICKSLNMSRRNLYYLFERHGGVAKYIKTARLEACYDVLTDPTDHRLVSTIAFQYGFTSMSAFSRQFKDEYGFSPREAREQRSATGIRFAPANKSIVDILLQSG